MSRTTIALASLLALAAACATSGRQGQAATSGATSPVASATPAPQGPKVICMMEYPTGSNIPEKVCRVQELVDREREATQDAIRTLNRTDATRGH